MMSENGSKTHKISLYVHIPFCARKCLFCSFVVSIGQVHRADEYVLAIAKEAERYRDVELDTVYLGGGTPSLLSEAQLDRLVGDIQKKFLVGRVSEWTIEANPESLDRSKTEFLRSCGFNRLSIGIQSFDDRYLKFLGRAHDREVSLKAYANARAAGFSNINLDLMFGFPGQTLEELAKDVRTLIDLESEHVSLYTLTIEENSRFYVKGLKLDDDEHLAKQYVQICESLESRGIGQYEISNFAKPGFESKHNSGYWEGSSYIGLGVGAHGFLGGRRYWNVSKLHDYLALIQDEQETVEGYEKLGPRTLLMERILFGLRKNAGICLSEIEKELNVTLDEERRVLIETWISDGFLEKDGERICATIKGRLILDELSSRLI